MTDAHTHSPWRVIATLVPADFVVPTEIELAGILLRPLGLNDLAPDFEAVVESRDRLIGLFSPDDPWPDGLTLHQDAVDLGWHEKEFQRRTSFAWGLWSGGSFDDGARPYLGSAYLYPDPSGHSDVLAVHWIRSGMVKSSALPAFALAWRRWIVEDWPFEKVEFTSPEDRQ